jgi:hypothetical protein
LGQAQPKLAFWREQDACARTAAIRAASIVLLAGLLWPASATRGQTPDIQLEGSNGPVVVASDTIVRGTVSLNPGPLAGLTGTYWIVADSSTGSRYSYVPPSGWVAGLTPTLTAPLTTVQNYQFLNQVLPAGSFTFYFGISVGPQWWVDSCQVTVTSANEIACIDFHSQPPYPEIGDGVDLNQILPLMDANNVSVSILSARGDLKYTFEVAAFAAANPSRIVAAASTKLTGMETTNGFIDGLQLQVQSGQFQALAEILLYHSVKYDENGTPVAPEIIVTPLDERTQAYIQAARHLGCPAILHLEFQTLENLYGTARRTQFMSELKQVLAANPDWKFVLTHAAELTPAQCRGLIADYANIYFTINFRDLAALMNGEPVPNYSEADWLALFQEQPARFIFAFERVFLSQWLIYTGEMQYFREKLALLPETAAQAIARDNARSLWGYTVREKQPGAASTAGR